MANNWQADRRTAHRLIRNWGGKGKLRRNSVDRDCVCAVVDYRPFERSFVIEGARRALISTYLADGTELTVVPDPEQDLLVFGGEVLRIEPPLKGPRPGGTVVYYDAQVLYDSQA